MKSQTILFLLIFTLINSSFAFSEEENSSDETTTLSDVVVTAAGIEQDSQDLAVSISSVTPAQAEWAKPSWIGELLNQEAGVAAFQLRGPVDKFAIRQPSRFDNVYLYLQDSVPLQSAISFNHAAFSYSSALTSPGGIEILKGPGTALHGTGAFAGVINVKSRKPNLEERETDVQIRGGQYGLFDFRAEINQPVNDNHAMRFAFSHQSEDGWRDTTDWNREQFVGRHLFESDDQDLTVNTIGTFTYFDSGMAGSLRRSAFLNNPKSDGLNAQVNRDDARDKNYYYRLSSEIEKALSDKVRLITTPYVRYIDQQYLTVWEPSTTPIVDSKTGSIGVLNKLYYTYDNGARTTFGFDVERTKFDFHREQTRPDATVFGTFFPQGVNYDYEVVYISLAPFIQHEHPLTDRLTATAGLRYEYSKYDFSNNLTEVAGDADSFLQVADRTDSFDQFSPKFGLSYRLTDDDFVFFRYAHGFKIPSASDLYNLTESNATFRLDPEKVDSYEIGYKGQLDNDIRFDITGFYLRTKDGIATGVPLGNVTVSQNGGETEFYGVEVASFVPLSDEFDVTVAFSYQESEVLKEFANMSSSNDGKDQINAPQTLGNLRLEYNPTWLKRFRGAIEMQHIGSWYLDEANTLSTDNEFIFNLRAEYAVNENVSIDLKILNLFDELYAATAEAPSWAPSGIYRPGQPFTVSAGIKILF